MTSTAPAAPAICEAHVPPYAFVLRYRDVEVDEGLTIQVYGPVQGRQEEILRFDCFRETPHYHLAFSYEDRRFIEIDDPQPYQWAVSTLASSFHSLVERSGAEALLSEEDRPALLSVLDRLRSEGDRYLSSRGTHTAC